MSITVVAPVAGEAVGLGAVPDPVFAGALVGPGTAIEPERVPGTALAPVDGTIAKLHPHAYVVVTDAGQGVLVHLGIDTVQLAGAGFDLLVAEGDGVSAGTPLIRWDPAAVQSGGRAPICPVVALDASADAVSVIAEGTVRAGADLFVWR